MSFKLTKLEIDNGKYFSRSYVRFENKDGSLSFRFDLSPEIVEKINTFLKTECKELLTKQFQNEIQKSNTQDVYSFDLFKLL